MSPGAMGKKTTKTTSTPGEGCDQRVEAAANGAPESSTAAANKKAANKSPSTAPQSPLPALIICRNKHWKYISSFHGPWLQLPIEVLETVANANYYMPLPRPVDPAVFYDLVKIRKLVDEATDLAVRAANGVSSPAMSNSSAGGNAHQMQALGFGYANNGGMKLSPERRFKLREQATQRLSRAYHIDEIASSVATMQSTSTLENVASLVLQRAPQDPDANYVHFFHEKIPSRQLAECTDFRALDLIINQRHADCEPLRTRAIVRMFKNDFEGAAQDLTRSLAVYRTYNSLSHQLSYKFENMQIERRTARRRDMPLLDERDQPRSIEVQLLFQRAGCYLTLACNHVHPSLSKRSSHRNGTADVASNGTANAEDAPLPSPTVDEPPTEKGPTKQELENRKAVRMYAKRALRDYMEFLKSLQYSHDMPIELSDDFTRLVNQASHRSRRYQNQARAGYQDPSSPTDRAHAHTVYSLHELFSATPPTHLPPYPSTDLVSSHTLDPETTMEFVTYHPLLTDVLHSLLLCHALIQTSAKELQRHAYMVARLARLADGYPIFQASRSPARADWIEILRRSEGWLDLPSTWEALCAPAPLLTTMAPGGNLSPATAAANALAITNGPGPTESDEQRKDRLKHQAIIDALADERVNDEETFKASILARQRRAEAEQAIATGGATNGSSNGTAKSPSLSSQKRWAVDDGREYPILTERAEAVARWVREAPAGAGVGGGKRKKKPGSAKRPASTTVTESTESLDAIAVQ